MKKTEEKQKKKNGRHKAKSTVGDIIFRVLILVLIFIICLLAYLFYIETLPDAIYNNNNKITTQIQKYN